jgi:2-keto-4-pentenoate hydratase/2-oxohepta-3-ene-1,7-dioic acid hydratase in catechol pathway
VKVARFSAGAGPRIGIVDGDVIIELDTSSVLDAVTDVGPRVAEGRRHAIADVRLLCPAAPLVRNAFCVGWNYLKHFEEGRRGTGITEPPARPTIFTKATGAVIGPSDPIEAHGAVTSMLDWEVELAILIGRPGRDISEADAMAHIAGFMVALDVTARDVSRAHGGQWFRGKSLDNTSPVGPWLVTPDEVGDLAARRIACSVNGEVVQSAVLGDMYFGLGRIIAELSAGLSLKAGDLIFTGTPEGTGIGQDPARFLAVGDVVEASIDGVGHIKTDVVRSYPPLVDSADIFDYVYDSSAAEGKSA